MHQYTSYLDWIDSQKERLQGFVKTWCNINTFSTHLIGLHEFRNILQTEFERLNGKINIISLPPYKIINDKGNPIEIQLGQALSIQKRPNAPIKILLGGHMDTVFPPECIFQNIEKVSSTIWKGPGIVDMKGGLAVMLLALETLERSPFADKIGWEIIINPDEEIGSPVSKKLYEQAAKRNHIGLIFEPSFPDGAFVSSRKGSANFTITIRGKSSHVGRDFYMGRSAIYAMAQFISQIEEWQAQDPETFINVGKVEGGVADNIVPDLAILQINIRTAYPDKFDQFHEKLQSIADFVQNRDGIKVEIFLKTDRHPKPLDESTKALFNYYSECAKDLDIPFQLRETGGVCDGNILAHAGLPTLDTLGVTGGALHTYEEYLLLPSLIERAKLCALFLLKIGNGEIIINKESLHV